MYTIEQEVQYRLSNPRLPLLVMECFDPTREDFYTSMIETVVYMDDQLGPEPDEDYVIYPFDDIEKEVRKQLLNFTACCKFCDNPLNNLCLHNDWNRFQFCSEDCFRELNELIEDGIMDLICDKPGFLTPHPPPYSITYSTYQTYKTNRRKYNDR